MTKSLNIPITDEYVWESVKKTVLQSSILKEGFKDDVLKSKFSTDEQIKQELKNQKVKSQRLRGELAKVQSTIADVETNNLLKKYDAEVYKKGRNLDEELKKIKNEIEQTRIRVKELGKEQKWLDWMDKYADQVGEMSDYKDEQKKEYLDGVVDKILVSLDKDTNDHHLDVVFRLPLVGDGIEYKDKKNKTAGYKLIDGDVSQQTVIPHKVVSERGKVVRREGRRVQNSKKKQLTTQPQTNKTVE